MDYSKDKNYILGIEKKLTVKEVHDIIYTWNIHFPSNKANTITNGDIEAVGDPFADGRVWISMWEKIGDM